MIDVARDQRRPGMSEIVQVFGRRDYGLTTDCGGRRPKSAKVAGRQSSFNSKR
jgi:hypothetical protein